MQVTADFLGLVYSLFLKVLQRCSFSTSSPFLSVWADILHASDCDFSWTGVQQLPVGGGPAVVAWQPQAVQATLICGQIQSLSVSQLHASHPLILADASAGCLCSSWCTTLYVPAWTPSDFRPFVDSANTFGNLNTHSLTESKV